MNKRKAKKLRKKQDMFVTSFASSYREVRELDRAYHEFAVIAKRAERNGCKLKLEVFGEDEFWGDALWQ